MEKTKSTINLYWENPYKTEFTAKILKITKSDVILDRTLFFPMGGGQSSDRGWLFKGKDEFPISEVIKENIDGIETIIHRLDPKIKDNKLFQNEFKVGDEIKGKIDWDYRYGLMKAHTSQHIISADILKNYGINTGEVLIHSEVVTLHLEQKITEGQLQNTLKNCMLICTGRGIDTNSYIMSHNEAEERFSKKIRGKIVDENPVRVMEIPDWDIMCCGGTHVSNTAEIGPIFVLKFNRGQDLKYFVGSRAINAIAEMNISFLNMANSLSQSIFDVESSVEKKIIEFKDLQEKNKEFESHILELLRDSSGIKIGNSFVKILNIPVDKKSLIAGFNQFPSGSILISNADPKLISILSSSDELNAKQFLQYLIEHYGGKGGGNSKTASGKLEQEPEEIVNDFKKYFENLNK